MARSSAPSAYSTQTVGLDGRGSSDTGGQITAYQWTQVSGPPVTLTNASGAEASFVVPRLDAAAQVRVSLRVTDDAAATGTSEVVVDVGPAPVQLDVSVAGGARFIVDDQTANLLVRSAMLNGAGVTPVAINWRSSVQGSLGASVALNQPQPIALQAGQHTLTVAVDVGDLGVVSVSRTLPVLPRMLPIAPYLATPAAGYAQLMPVVLASYFPTVDGVSLDLQEANYAVRPPEWTNNSVADLTGYVQKIVMRQKFILEEMSRFRGYKTPASTSYLGYQVVAHYAFYEPWPLSTRTTNGAALVDVGSIIARIDGRSWVNDSSVREFWFNGYHNDKLVIWESNMASPTTGDISNSDRFAADLPVFDDTYIVYGTNYHRTQAEAVHNHGHQIEAMLDYVDRRFSGNSGLFWGQYVGVPNHPGPAMVPGRCGWTHQPPNTTTNYGYLDATTVQVDCENWRPDGTGAKTAVNSSYFANLGYVWPDGNLNIPQKAETQFYIWWGQNMPSHQSAIPYNATTLENWWRFMGDWDTAFRNQARLYK